LACGGVDEYVLAAFELWLAVIAMANLNQIMDLALALSALLAVAAEEEWPLKCVDARPNDRGWLPWVLLIALAIGSIGFGFMHPAEFAAASGEGFFVPGQVGIAIGRR
jgi:hypothetical protein